MEEWKKRRLEEMNRLRRMEEETLSRDEENGRRGTCDNNERKVRPLYIKLGSLETIIQMAQYNYTIRETIIQTFKVFQDNITNVQSLAILQTVRD